MNEIECSSLSALLTAYGVKGIVDGLASICAARAERSTGAAQAVWDHDARKLREAVPTLWHRGAGLRPKAGP